MKAHHRVNVIRVAEVQAHPNADRLEIVPIEGYQAVVGKGQFKVGDLAYYIPPDSIVPEKDDYAFLWGNSTYEGGVPVRKRRITAKKIRGQWSEGLLMPILSLVGNHWNVTEGDDLSSDLGITHYEPPEPGEGTAAGGNEGNAKRRRYPKTPWGWFWLIVGWLRGERREGGISLPTYDVDAFKNYKNVLQPNENVFVTEKIHGSNARFTYRTSVLGGKFYVGSRNLWKAEGSSCAWRTASKDNPWIERWCREHPNYALYGEITTQKGFDYNRQGKVRFFLFDIRRPDGKWAEVEEIEVLLESYHEAQRVPPFYCGPFDEETIKLYVDGPSTVEGAKHIREGIVIRAVPERQERNLGRVQLKIVSNEFLQKEAA